MDIHRSHYISDINEDMTGEKVRITGWVEDIRELGAITFLIIRDVSGSIQVITRDFNVTKQSIIAVNGIVQKSKAKAYKVEIKADSIDVLSKAKHPLPIDPTGRVKAGLDVRLDSRALDLRNPKTLAIFKIRHHALQAIRGSLIKNRFIEVNTPKIIGSASEGGANLFKLKYFDKQAYLAQSPQLYKEQLTMALDRVFEIAPYYRAEKSHTVRHLNEFISIDIEAAFLDAEDVMKIAEELIVDTITAIKDNASNELEELDLDLKVPSIPFERLTYEQVIDEVKDRIDIEFGDDLPDHALRLLEEKHKGFYFIKDWPLKLKPFYIHAKEDNEELSCSFDLQYGYLELASGGRREHDPEKLRARLREQGLDPKDFADHLRAFDWGMPPHSGWGLGFDRLMMVLTNTKNIREVVLYPRDTERLTP
ncbi:MAG: aspartate--tRNA(Asn) ligase [Candidatus Nitrosocaldaceae archaeon]|nr:MAG: aspartate--tRNA(Asn) ligase [Candidatus Nitrosocaldaceae archaeon]